MPATKRLLAKPATKQQISRSAGVTAADRAAVERLLRQLAKRDGEGKRTPARVARKKTARKKVARKAGARNVSRKKSAKKKAARRS